MVVNTILGLLTLKKVFVHNPCNLSFYFLMKFFIISNVCNQNQRKNWMVHNTF